MERTSWDTNVGVIGFRDDYGSLVERTYLVILLERLGHVQRTVLRITIGTYSHVNVLCGAIVTLVRSCLTLNGRRLRRSPIRGFLVRCV